MSYVNNMSYEGSLCQLYELCKSYENFHESRKINRFLFLKSLDFFC